MFKKCISSLFTNHSINLTNNAILKSLLIPASTIHTTNTSSTARGDAPVPQHWCKGNDFIYPPQELGEERRPAFICHMKTNIKYSFKKMWYIACAVRGLTVDEAVKQLSFMEKKGAVAVKETILEAQKIAVEKHNVEFKSNLWVSDSRVGKGAVIHGVRKCAKGRRAKITYGYVHYLLKLEEGTPPPNFYLRDERTKEELINDWKQKMRQRKIVLSL